MTKKILLIGACQTENQIVSLDSNDLRPLIDFWANGKIKSPVARFVNRRPYFPS